MTRLTCSTEQSRHPPNVSLFTGHEKTKQKLKKKKCNVLQNDVTNEIMTPTDTVLHTAMKFSVAGSRMYYALKDGEVFDETFIINPLDFHFLFYALLWQ